MLLYFVCSEVCLGNNLSVQCIRLFEFASFRYATFSHFLSYRLFFCLFFFFSFFSLRLFHFSNISRDFPAFYHATSNPRDLLSLLITIFLFFTDQPHTHTRTLSNTLSLAFLNPFTSRLFSILFFHLLPSNF